MKRSKLIAITGGIGSGKSSVIESLKRKGYEVLDADQISHELMGIDSVKTEIAGFFGGSVLDGEGNVDRRALGEIVFSDRRAMETLENIIHPKVVDEINKKASGSVDVLFVEIPILAEKYDSLRDSGFNPDSVWLVNCSDKTALERVMKRDSLTEKDALLRINSQADYFTRLRISNCIILNEGSLEDLEKEINSVLRVELEDKLE